MAGSTRPIFCTRATVKKEGLNIWVDDYDAQADIVLVQGLGAGPYNTWIAQKRKAQSSQTNASNLSSFKALFGQTVKREGSGEELTADEGDFFWPRDLLPGHVGPARIATYSYESNWRNTSFRAGLRACGEQFINILHQHRQDRATRQRPLIFVGHSLGGLIIQQALVLASHNRLFDNIRSSVAGTLYMGVPMRGADPAGLLSWATTAIGNDQPLLKTLRTESNELIGLLSDYWTRYDYLQVVCFVERYASSYGPLKTITVNEISGSAIGKRKINLLTDHSGLNKFTGEDDQNFQLFVPSLKEMLSLAQNTPPEESVFSSTQNQIMEHPVAKVARGAFLMPFVRDNKFVGRTEILTQIDAMISPELGQARVALVGLGGIGKSQIAIEYAYRFRQSSPKSHVFWVYGTNPARFRASYADIAKELQLDGWNDPQVDVLGSVHGWLRSERSGRWLMILDNLDDGHFVSFGYGQRNSKYYEFVIPQHIPQRDNTAILVTSRDKRASFDLVHQDPGRIVNIEAMDGKDTRVLFDTRVSSSKGTAEDKEVLIEKLDSIPLAITQAAAYINQRQRMTVRRYLGLLDVNDNDPKSVLNLDGGDSRRDISVPNAVFRTWEITLDLIQDRHRGAADLLATMSMFDRQGIPEYLLRSRHEMRSSVTTGYHQSGSHPTLGKHHFASDNDKINDSLRTGRISLSRDNITSSQDGTPFTPHMETSFEDDIDVLLDFSLITTEESGQTYQMHRLVQLATSCWLQEKYSYQQYQERALHLLARVYPNGRYGTWHHCRTLEPHAESIMRINFLSEKGMLARARLLKDRAIFLVEYGRHEQAENSLNLALKDLAKVLGEAQETFLEIMFDKIWLFRLRGRYHEAKVFATKYLHISKSAYGEHDDLSLRFVCVLALLNMDQGLLEEADASLKELVVVSTSVLGGAHPSTMWFSHTLASALSSLGRYEEAVKILEPLTTFRRRTLGDKHPDSSALMRQLGDVYSHQGRLEKAAEMYNLAVQVMHQTLGADCSPTMDSMCDLARTLASLGRLEEAKLLYNRVLAFFLNLRGERDHDLIKVMSNLSDVMMQLGDHAEALAGKVKAVFLSEIVRGPLSRYTRQRTFGLRRWLREPHIRENSLSEDVILQTQLQMETSIKESYSPSLAICLYEIYFRRCCQLKIHKSDKTLAAGRNTTEEAAGRRELIAALQLFIKGSQDRRGSLCMVGRILAALGREDDALVAFEGMLIPRYTHAVGRRHYQGFDLAKEDKQKILADSNYGELLIDHTVPSYDTMGTQSVDAGRVTGEEAINFGSSDQSMADCQIARNHPEDSDQEVSNAGALGEVWQQKPCVWAERVVCDGCDDRLSLPSTRYFCTECSDLGLCEACFEELQLNGLLDTEEMKTCSNNHRFLCAPRAEWYNLPWGVVSEDKTTLNEWINNLLEGLMKEPVCADGAPSSSTRLAV